MDIGAITQCIANPTVQQTIFDRLLGNATAVAAVWSDPAVLAGLMANPVVRAAVARDVSVQAAVLGSPTVKAGIAARYGGPGIMFGISLMFAVTVMDCGVGIWGKTLFMPLKTSPAGSSHRVHPPSYVLEHQVEYVRFLVIVPEIRDVLLVVAAAYRYAAVYSNPRHQRAVLIFQSVIAVVSTIAALAYGIHDIATQIHVSKGFWWVAIVNPLIYIVAGLATFTYKLRVAQQSVSSSAAPSQLAHLEMANNALMAMSMSALIAAIVVHFNVPSTGENITDPKQTKPAAFPAVADHHFVVPTQMMICALWTLGENGFEALAAGSKKLGDSKEVATPSFVDTQWDQKGAKTGRAGSVLDVRKKRDDV
ncbi:uncharacterized protein EV422DRAFT_509993 [Fimicolochytrium jonesii]|uniref:uncharacterized protein n=1 Tax=Fimicolochytrium jonesii TaxID=1396493 RepID=UPI0022FE80E8|nr:uncharacterized protein EV422DRAFT_509993 [Fimicolochytrium jonesii]KAI8816129.1 hypothetical protein EV422DRAFT_509993 [Fimicolochytrium jonesii]